MSCLKRKEEVSGNIFIRKNMNLQKGQVVPGHKHNFDHTTIVFTGSIRVRTPREGFAVFRAPDHFLVKKDVMHEITALENNTEFWCVFAHRDDHGEVVQEANGNRESYGISD